MARLQTPNDRWENTECRARKNNRRGVSAFAVAGTYVVTIGFDVTTARRKGLLGFSVHRTDHTENEQYWLMGYKVFDLPGKNVAPGKIVRTLEHPVQDFVWGDYTAKPGHKYTYRIVPQYGTPGNLKPGPEVLLDVETEDVKVGKHAVYFNRGVAGSQMYARRFENKSPDAFLVKGPGGQTIPFSGEAWEWLSRGLVEAMTSFIREAIDKRFAIRAAFYEFSYNAIGKELADAVRRGADIKLVLDYRDNGSSSSKARIRATEANLAAAGFPAARVHKRTENGSYISHNKFMVLLKDGQPEKVWTGSTNVTAGGIYGHSNVGHEVRDRRVALEVSRILGAAEQESPANELRQANFEAVADYALDPIDIPPRGVSCIFSPRTTDSMLRWYAALAAKTDQTICFTAAFGINDLFIVAFKDEWDSLRFVALESTGNKEEDRTKFWNNVRQFDRDVLLAIGSVLGELEMNPGLRTYLKESLSRLNTNVRYLHTKYLLVDPLSADPIVVSGSANFSMASTKNNDENMLIIRGDKPVADVYFGEFMRLFDHFRFRRFARQIRSADEASKRRAAYLVDNASWTDPFFDPENAKSKLRQLYASATV